MSDERYRDFVSQTQLLGISLAECSAKRTGDLDMQVGLDTRLTLELQHRVSEEGLGYRFHFTCCAQQAGAEVAKVSATFVATYTVDGSVDVDEDLAVDFAQDVVIMSVYPYMRELVQSLGARLDVPNFTMGMIKRGQFNMVRDSAG